MTVTINGTTGIDKVQDGSIQAADLASGVPSRSQLPAGTVLQVVQSFYKTGETIASATWTATGLTATITPTSASSKILVMVNATIGSTYDNYGGLRLYRNDSEVTGATSNQGTAPNVNAFIAITSINDNWTNVLSNSYLDSPASTSSQTYTIWWARTYNTGSLSMNRPRSLDAGNSYTIYAPSSITLMEIAA